jgi:hypothetical protein
MRFKTDENLPDQVAELLRESGSDSVTIHDQSMVGDSIRQERGLGVHENGTLVRRSFRDKDVSAGAVAFHSEERSEY